MELIGKRIYGNEIRIFAFGCVHYGTESHDEDLWIEFLKRLHKTQNAIAFGLGDYLDFARTHWRGFLKGWGEEDTFFDSIDDMVDGHLVKPFVAQVKRYCPSFKDKVLCLIEGNHHYKYGSKGRFGQTSTQEICRLLDVPYGGLSTWVRIAMYRSRSRTLKKFTTSRNMNILLNHGQSSGGTITAALGKLERQTITGWRGIDALISSHNHMLGHVVSTQIGATQKGHVRLVDYPLLLVKSGCFKISYKEGAQSESFEEKS